MSEKYKTYKFKTSFHDFLIELTKSELARDNFIHTIISTNYDNCFLEFPVLNKKTYDDKVEFTITESCSFHDSDWQSFTDKLKPLIESKSNLTVTSFYNPSKDALLVVPVPSNNQSDIYSNHLMNFLKQGSKKQQHDLIKIFAMSALGMAENDESVYISTHGHGVPWLHVRLSKTPKYYQHKEYIPSEHMSTHSDSKKNNTILFVIVCVCVLVLFCAWMYYK